jgi:hypothetical protein
MPSAVALKGLGNGVLVDSAGNALSFRRVNVYTRGTTSQVQVYSDEALSLAMVQPLVTGSDGTPGAVPGYIVAEQEIDFVDVLSGSRAQGEAISAGDVALAVSAVIDSPLIVMPRPSGDIAGATDTPAIQALFDAAPSGSTFLFPQGTYWINQTLALRAGCAFIGVGQSELQSCLIKQANGANIQGALLASAGWVNNSLFGDAPVTVRNIAIDVNEANNPTSTACGIIYTSFWSKVEDNWITNTSSHGVLLTDYTKNGSVLTTNTGSTTKVKDNWFWNIGDQALCQKVSNVNSFLDGWCSGNQINGVGAVVGGHVVAGWPTGAAVSFTTSAGWWIEDNHLYGAVPAHAFLLGRMFNTTFLHNEIENFGDVPALGNGYVYTAISGVVLEGRGSLIDGNTIGISTSLGSGAQWAYIIVNGSSGDQGVVNVVNNSLTGTYQGTQIGVSIYSAGTLHGEVTGNSSVGVGVPLYWQMAGQPLSNWFCFLHVHDNTGFNPVGDITSTSALPASGSPTLPVPYDSIWYITPQDAVTTVQVTAASFGTSGPVLALPGNAIAEVRVPANTGLTITYGTNPLFKVMGL